MNKESLMLPLVFAVCAVMNALAPVTKPPAEVLDLQPWKLTVPFDTDDDGKPEEILQPRLATYQQTDAFFVSESGDAIHFRARCGGLPTKGSDYPRSELREMLPDGSDEFEWATDDGQRHLLELEQAIVHLPEKKQHVVCAQIHDAKNDLILIRLEEKKLFVERDGLDDVMLDSSYELGTRFRLKILAEAGHVKVFYNDQPRLDWAVSRKGCYFKAGCYTQSNVKKGDSPQAYAEVAIYRLQVTHEK